ncbi:cysteine dioxygenase family protein [Kitasatospora sp. YST-16]|uniref:cysteine dioxygenase n=1 Tax=Kitasatospora sp. YST-16 TaxID=2998080 RepID=UPI00228451F4|nr:cysteine dioxygenase family protein [Kitasatospora sp. YST-16]WAL75072.1 cysteine dioxygenase family protein [Kitasatospora sp. YST-16]WNW41129.1 cysteine dioxygenase family protein [Streptomyces sp. Li-HN-5-13]
MSIDLATVPSTATTTPPTAATAATAPPTAAPRPPLSPNALRRIVRDLAERPERWLHRVRLSAEERWYERLELAEDYEVWLISWLPGQSTGFHDHGGSRGAFTVALGELEELALAGPEHGLTVRRLASGTERAFGPQYLHDVRNTAQGPAVTLHAYSPPLSEMAHYELRAGGLVRTSTEGAEQW